MIGNDDFTQFLTKYIDSLQHTQLLEMQSYTDFYCSEKPNNIMIRMRQDFIVNSNNRSTTRLSNIYYDQLVT